MGRKRRIGRMRSQGRKGMFRLEDPPYAFELGANFGTACRCSQSIGGDGNVALEVITLGRGVTMGDRTDGQNHWLLRGFELLHEAPQCYGLSTDGEPDATRTRG
eukprot:GHVT01048696.1.p2 GENE.GHVT01048696.1~~GHVT01048696.1.p2  ORF type:complete len:104 (+),score=6.21 GHVT01048696.1:994-1305(+)